MSRHVKNQRRRGKVVKEDLIDDNDNEEEEETTMTGRTLTEKVVDKDIVTRIALRPATVAEMIEESQGRWESMDPIKYPSFDAMPEGMRAGFDMVKIKERHPEVYDVLMKIGEECPEAVTYMDEKGRVFKGKARENNEKKTTTTL